MLHLIITLLPVQEAVFTGLLIVARLPILLSVSLPVVLLLNMVVGLRIV